MVEEASRIKPGPDNVPPNHLFMSEAILPQLLDWAHFAPLTSHPGVAHALVLLSCQFCWPIVRRDTMEFVVACMPCAHSKAIKTHPSGLLRPLAVP